MALVIGPVLRDMRRRQRVILGWQIATVVLSAGLLATVIAIAVTLLAKVQ
jgi:hypothetical protein